MRKLYIQSFSSIFLDPEDEAPVLSDLKCKLPKRAARRMSRLGIMLHGLLVDQPIDLQTTLVYGTSFSESSALESYLDSLPAASPTAFQTSIHPGGVEQALILDNREVGPFFPMAGSQNLMTQMLKVAFSASTSKIIICGGEERGNWLRDLGLAHDSSFAFAMRITDDQAGACGELSWDQDKAAEPGQDTLPGIAETVRLFTQGKAVTFQKACHGVIKMIPM